MTSLAFVMFILSFFFPTFCFCFPISSSPLSCFIEIEVLITAQANLELTEYLPHRITRKTTIFPTYQIPMTTPLLFLQCLCNHLLSFYDSEDKKNQGLKKLLEWFLCYIHCYLVYKLKQPFNRVKLHHNSQLHSGSLEL